MESGVFITKQLFPALFEWFARHIFALPVHNALAERQFNIATLYLDPNMSKESIKATQLFVPPKIGQIKLTPYDCLKLQGMQAENG